MRPTISIVMPAYNAGRTIGDAIRSVVAQSRSDFELVICNDASTDNTAAIMNGFTDSRIHVVENRVNRGGGPSRDNAIRAACGRWITVLDADDVYMPNRLEALLEVAEQHPEAVVFDEIMDCHDTPRGLVAWRPVRNASVFRSGSHTNRPVTTEAWVAAARTLIKPVIPTALIRQLEITHPAIRFGEDLAFLLSLLAKSRAPLWYVPEPLYLYRLTADSMSTVPDRFTQLAQVLEDAVPQFNWDPNIQTAIRRKAAETRKRATYQFFLSAFMEGQLGRAMWNAVIHPWVLPEFCCRSVERIPYHLSRWLHSGAHRRTI